MVTKPQKDVYDKQILYISSWSLFYINYEKLRDTSFPISLYRNIINTGFYPNMNSDPYL